MLKAQRLKLQTLVDKRFDLLKQRPSMFTSSTCIEPILLQVNAYTEAIIFFNFKVCMRLLKRIFRTLIRSLMTSVENCILLGVLQLTSRIDLLWYAIEKGIEQIALFEELIKILEKVWRRRGVSNFVFLENNSWGF